MRKKLLSMLVLLMVAVTGAWATEVTIATNQQQTSYTSGDITISVSNVGDGDGAFVSSWCPMIITCGDGNVLQSVVVTIGFYPDNASDVTASAGSREVSGDGNKHSTYVTVTGINASSVSIGCNGDVQIEQVVVNYGPRAPEPEPQPAGYAVSLKAETVDEGNWTAKAGEGEYQSLPLEGVAEGTQVTLKYAGLKKVKSVKAMKKAPAAPSYDNTLNINTYDPSLNDWKDVTVPTGKHWLITGTGEATTNVIIIANNATVTLSGVNITAFGRSLTCEGNATIILADGTTNNLYSAEGEWGAAGIEMSGGSGTSLTIQGNTGVLNITSGSGPAIGAGYGHAGCAINIEGGIINATSTDGPGIGAAYSTACGNITISGGTVAATGGYGCPGIGGAGSANCGDITITSGVTSVTATKGSEAPYSIGASSSGSCGTVTIGGVVGAITESPFTYPAPAEPAGPTTVTWDFSQLSGSAEIPYENGGVTLSGEAFLDFENNILGCMGECTFTAPEGKKFTSIVITASDFEFHGTGWSGSTWSDSDGQTTINFMGGASGISTIVFTLEGASAAGLTSYTLAESTVGMIVGTNGLAYAVEDKDNLPDGVTAAGVVVYKNGANGLAIALTDEASMMDWATACGESGAAAHTPTVEGQTWKLPSQEEWTLVKNANSGTSLNSAITSAGGTAIPTVHFDHETQIMTGKYWLSTEGGFAEAARTWGINGYDEIAVDSQDFKTSNNLVRACLAW